MNMNDSFSLTFQICDVTINLRDHPTILACGSTGCGKSYLLKKIWKQLSRNYRGKLKFVFIDLKMVEFTNIIEDGKLFPVCLETDKVDGILDNLLTKSYDFPIVVVWDVFEDYLYSSNEALDKFRRLLNEGPKRKIYTVTCSSRVDMGKEYTNLFSTIFLGEWYQENIDDFFNDSVKKAVAESGLDLTKLRQGEFILIKDNGTRLVKDNMKYTP